MAGENEFLLKLAFDSTVALPTDCRYLSIKLNPRELLTLAD
jgi:hypothetical protein